MFGAGIGSAGDGAAVGAMLYEILSGSPPLPWSRRMSTIGILVESLRQGRTIGQERGREMGGRQHQTVYIYSYWSYPGGACVLYSPWTWRHFRYPPSQCLYCLTVHGGGAHSRVFDSVSSWWSLVQWVWYYFDNLLVSCLVSFIIWPVVNKHLPGTCVIYWMTHWYAACWWIDALAWYRRWQYIKVIVWLIRIIQTMWKISHLVPCWERSNTAIIGRPLPTSDMAVTKPNTRALPVKPERNYSNLRIIYADSFGPMMCWYGFPC